MMGREGEQQRRREAGAIFARRRQRQRAALMSGFEALYGRDSDDLLLTTGAEAMDAVAFLKSADPLRYRPQNGAQYPRGVLGQQLRQIAQLIRANVGLEIAFAEVGGWDTHVNQGGAQGQLALRLTELGSALAAFAQDLDDRLDEVVVLTMSEFGRTVEENGNIGTDHGHANASLLLGGGVNGGKVYGEWPGLAPEQRFEGRDLALTTDFRDLFAEVADLHLRPRDPRHLFPGHDLDRRHYRGLIRT